MIEKGHSVTNRCPLGQCQPLTMYQSAFRDLSRNKDIEMQQGCLVMYKFSLRLPYLFISLQFFRAVVLNLWVAHQTAYISDIYIRIQNSGKIMLQSSDIIIAWLRL